VRSMRGWDRPVVWWSASLCLLLVGREGCWHPVLSSTMPKPPPRAVLAVDFAAHAWPAEKGIRTHLLHSVAHWYPRLARRKTRARPRGTPGLLLMGFV
jgi:hypothetical protein